MYLNNFQFYYSFTQNLPRYIERIYKMSSSKPSDTGILQTFSFLIE